MPCQGFVEQRYDSRHRLDGCRQAIVSQVDVLLPLRRGIVYGPIWSRRLGLSLGINIFPPRGKTCNFNCSYCQYGTRVSLDPADLWPAPAMIGAALSRHLRRARARGQRFDRVTLAGRGEPTLHPRFAEVVKRVRAARDRHAPRTHLAILSNSSTADIPSVRAALSELDEHYMKLDAGDPITLRLMNASPIPLTRIVEALRTLPDIVIQTMFVYDPLARMDNSSDAAVGAWIRAVSRICPTAVHIYTLARPPACSFLRRLPDTSLLELARRVRDIGIPAQAFLSSS